MPALRVPQQLGTPRLLPGIAVVGFFTHRPRLAVPAALALPVEKGLEMGVKVLFERRLIAPYLPTWCLGALVAAVGATTFTRVHQGAHFGVRRGGRGAEGVSAGAVLTYAFGLPNVPGALRV